MCQSQNTTQGEIPAEPAETEAATAGGMNGERELFQRDVDATSAPDYYAFRTGAAVASTPGLARYDAAFDRVFEEVRSTPASAGAPAVWLLYNMGVVVKTGRVTFGIDIAHRQGARLAPLLDFALITHNHDDHWDPAFYRAMDGAGKTVVSSFLDNYGAMRSGNPAPGYTRTQKTFEFGDAIVKTAFSDHNPYLVDFTTTFEITVGGWTLYHTGDSQNIAKLSPAMRPDLWIVHPLCGLEVDDGVRKFHPARVAICHLCELGHPPDKWRWSLADGLACAEKAAAAGAEAIVPLWGERMQ